MSSQSWDISVESLTPMLAQGLYTFSTYGVLLIAYRWIIPVLNSLYMMTKYNNLYMIFLKWIKGRSDYEVQVIWI